MDSMQQGKEMRKDMENSSGSQSMIIPVVEEHMTVDKETIETAKIHVRTRVTEEEATINMPIKSEQYEVMRVPVDKVFSTIPPVRYEGDTLIVPVVEEVIVVEKRYRVIEEVHLVKQTTEMPFMQQVTLRKENIQVERTSSDGEKTEL